ncbi:MAG: hypothetical protein PHH09_13715 [Methanoregulaceae archaeon]|nr:hypothetical protein [Methanoregulaceae archaeon]
MRKKLSEIAREEWIGINWIEDSQMNEEERHFRADGLRTPAEAYQAREEWDATAEERMLCVAMVKA